MLPTLGGSGSPSRSVRHAPNYSVGGICYCLCPPHLLLPFASSTRRRAVCSSSSPLLDLSSSISSSLSATPLGPDPCFSPGACPHRNIAATSSPPHGTRLTRAPLFLTSRLSMRFLRKFFSNPTLQSSRRPLEDEQGKMNPRVLVIFGACSRNHPRCANVALVLW